MCKKCCIAHVSRGTNIACKTRDHAPPPAQCKTEAASASNAAPVANTANINAAPAANHDVVVEVASPLPFSNSDANLETPDVIELEEGDVDIDVTSSSARMVDFLNLLGKEALADEDLADVGQLVHGTREADDVVLQIGNDPVSQADMHRLDGPRLPPTKLATRLWLNDKIIAALRNVLVGMDAKLFELDSTRQKTYYADSFFYMHMMQLRERRRTSTNEVHTTTAM